MARVSLALVAVILVVSLSLAVGAVDIKQKLKNKFGKGYAPGAYAYGDAYGDVYGSSSAAAAQALGRGHRGSFAGASADAHGYGYPKKSYYGDDDDYDGYYGSAASAAAMTDGPYKRPQSSYRRPRFPSRFAQHAYYDDDGGSAASAAAAAGGHGAAAASAAVSSRGPRKYRKPKTYSNSFASATGTFSNDDNGKERSSYRRNAEKVKHFEDGHVDDDHYYNAQSYGKSDDDNLHEAYKKKKEKVEATPNVYRSNKVSENYVKNHNKATRRTGSGVVAKDKRKSGFSRNYKKSIENVDQKHKKEGPGLVEQSNYHTRHQFNDDDEEIYDSSGVAAAAAAAASGDHAAAGSAAAAGY